MTTQMALLGLGGALVVYFLYRVFKGSASRTLAVPPAVGAGLILFSLQAHPAACAVAGLLVYLVVSRVIETSIRWAATAAVVDGVDLGPMGALERQARLGDFWIPNRGIFAFGDARFEVLDPARHSRAMTRWTREAPVTRAAR